MKITQFNPLFPKQDGIAQGSDQSGAIYHEYYLHGEKIIPLELEDAGYRLTGRFVVVDNRYKLFELLPIDSSFRASHSFLAPNFRSYGVVIRRTFNEHKAELNPVTAQARYAARETNGRAPTGVPPVFRKAM